MSTLSFKEKNLLLILGVVLLYGVAALSYKPKMTSLNIAKRNYEREAKKLQEERALIAARNDWTQRYETMRSMMPPFPYERDVVTYWLSMMDAAASRQGLTISNRQANKEVEVGDVYELPIDCSSWEGTLEQLVKFLYDLDQKGAMLDMRQLTIRTSTKQGFLKGSFTLYCAYMRGDVKQ
jgi:Tfp pilus assembly protein PilO